MRRSTHGLRRALLAPALILCLVLAGSGPAVADGYTAPNDYQTGRIGHYDFDDYALNGHEGNVDCDYHIYSNLQHRLTKFVFRLPRIWWYDHDSGTTHEHGTVGWQVRIQKSSDPVSQPFSTVYTSSVQRRTAHEDHPGYSNGDRAPFSTRTLDWTSGHPEFYRVKYTVFWYRANGTVKGTLSHWYTYYDSSDVGQVYGYCASKYIEF